MAEPTKKSPEINKFLSSVTGVNRESTIYGDRCVICGGPANEFRDELSRREYRISGMCQKCQNSVFDAPDNS